MKITVKLFATLRDQRFDTSDVDCPEGSCVRDILRIIKLPEDEVAIIFLNGRHAEFDDIINSNDTLAFFPPIGGG